MKRRIIVGLCAALLAGVTSVAGAEIKIGVVNVQRLASESPQAQAASNAIQAEFTTRYKTLQDQEAALQARQEKLSKDAPTMTEIQRSAADKELRDGVRDLQAKRSAFEDDLNARNQDEKAKLSRVLDEEVAAFARSQGYDLILGDGVYFASSAVDVTDAILKSLQNRRQGTAPAAGAPAGRPAAPPAAPAKP